MLTKLTAEESFLAAERVAVGSVPLKAHGLQAIRARWQSDVGVRRPKAQKIGDRRDLAALGIGYVPFQAPVPGKDLG